MWRRLSRGYPLKLEFIPFLLLVWSIYVVMSHYSQLPQQIPTHFSAAGNPDRWGAKGILILLLAVEVGLVYIPLTLLSLAIGAIADFRPLINLPGRGREELSLAQGEAIRMWVLRLLLVNKTLAIGLIAYILYNSVQIALGQRAGIGWGWWLLAAALALSSLFIVGKLIGIARKKAV